MCMYRDLLSVEWRMPTPWKPEIGVRKLCFLSFLCQLAMSLSFDACVRIHSASKLRGSKGDHNKILIMVIL